MTGAQQPTAFTLFLQLLDSQHVAQDVARLEALAAASPADAQSTAPRSESGEWRPAIAYETDHEPDALEEGVELLCLM